MKGGAGSNRNAAPDTLDEAPSAAAGYSADAAVFLALLHFLDFRVHDIVVVLGSRAALGLTAAG